MEDVISYYIKNPGAFILLENQVGQLNYITDISLKLILGEKKRNNQCIYLTRWKEVCEV